LIEEVKQNMAKAEMKTYGIRMPVWQREGLDTIAGKDGNSAGSLVRTAVGNLLEQHGITAEGKEVNAE
jgi:predicted DNA-binding protein